MPGTFYAQDAKIGFFDEYLYLCENVKIRIVKKKISKLSLLFLAAMMMCLTGCNKIKQIRVTSCKVEAISPEGLRSLNVFLAVGIDNPALQIGLSEIDGSLKHSGKIIGKLGMDPFVLQARSAEIYHLRANLSLADGASLMDLMVLTDKEKLYECMVDVSVKATLKGGVSKTIRINDIPLKKLLEKAGNEKDSK